MRTTLGVLSETETAYPSGAPGFTPDFLVRLGVAQIFSFLCCVDFLLPLFYVLCPLFYVLCPMLYVTLDCLFLTI